MSNVILDAVQETATMMKELARHKRLVRALRDRSNWTRDGKWSPLMTAHDKDIFAFIDKTLAEETISEDQQKLPI